MNRNNQNRTTNNMLNRKDQYPDNNPHHAPADGEQTTLACNIPPGKSLHPQPFTIWSGPGKTSPHSSIPYRKILPVSQNQSSSNSRYHITHHRDSTLSRITTPVRNDRPPFFEHERRKCWGWQLPLFPDFFPPLPPVDDPPVPEHLDDTLPQGDIPGQLLLDLGL